MKRLLLILLILPILSSAKAQESAVQDTVKKPDLTLEKKLEEEIAAAPIKKKKNFYFDEKVKRAWTSTINRNKKVIEEFNILKEPRAVDRYVQSIYVYDRAGQRITKVKPSKNPMEALLHGPYQKFQDGLLIEEGVFFYGTKHQRWLRLDAKQKLLNKEHFHKGWYRDSDISYYDLDKKSKVKEVVPVQYGKKEGSYYQFFDNGKMAVKGVYQFDQRIGIWEEYYNTARTTVKREIQYPKDAFDKTPPFIRKEWDSRGNLIYTSQKTKSR